MDNGDFDAKAVREALTPRMSRLELGRKMGVSDSYIRDLEAQRLRWNARRLTQFHEVIAAWRENPQPTPRKPRNDIGKKHRKFKHKRRANGTAAAATCL